MQHAQNVWITKWVWGEKKLWIKIFHPNLHINEFDVNVLQLQESTSCDFGTGLMKLLENLDSLITEMW